MIETALGSGVIAVVRLGDATGLRDAATALALGGVKAVEITLTTPGALEAIAELSSDRSAGQVVGAGTVLDEAAARDAITAGARFVVSPTLDRGVVRYCRDRDVPCMPGAFTPTELLEGWRAGAPILKLFPASAVGPRYLREILAPLPFLRIVPSGGVSLDNADEWIRAGAVAVSVGSALVSASLVGQRRWADLTERARALVERVAAARPPSPPPPPPPPLAGIPA